MPSKLIYSCLDECDLYNAMMTSENEKSTIKRDLSRSCADHAKKA